MMLAKGLKTKGAKDRHLQTYDQSTHFEVAQKLPQLHKGKKEDHRGRLRKAAIEPLPKAKIRHGRFNNVSNKNEYVHSNTLTSDIPTGLYEKLKASLTVFAYQNILTGRRMPSPKTTATSLQK